MAETLIRIEGSKHEQYLSCIKQVEALIGNEKNLIANLANITAALKETFGWFWVGFYLVEDKELVLGPFQGPIACSRIAYGQGVCGTAWKRNETLIVPNIDEFPGHIACSAHSKSEIVVPISKNNTVVAVLDIDSDQFSTFDETDSHHLNSLCAWLANYF